MSHGLRPVLPQLASLPPGKDPGPSVPDRPPRLSDAANTAPSWVTTLTSLPCSSHSKLFGLTHFLFNMSSYLKLALEEHRHSSEDPVLMSLVNTEGARQVCAAGPPRICGSSVPVGPGTCKATSYAGAACEHLVLRLML